MGVGAARFCRRFAARAAPRFSSPGATSVEPGSVCESVGLRGPALGWNSVPAEDENTSKTGRPARANGSGYGVSTLALAPVRAAAVACPRRICDHNHYLYVVASHTAAIAGGMRAREVERAFRAWTYLRQASRECSCGYSRNRRKGRSVRERSRAVRGMNAQRK